MHDRTFVHVVSSRVCVLALLLGACDQPAPKCNVAHGAFWAQYERVSGEGECAMLVGEELDVQSYYAQRSKDDKRPDYDKASIAIQPFTITAALGNAAGLAEPEAADVPYAIGRFGTTAPRSDGFCVAPKLTTAQLHLADVPAHEVDMCTSAPAAPAVDVSYAFSNVRVYFTPAAIGTQFTADLTYTQAGCVAKYKVAAVYPIVSCGAPTPLEDAGVSDAETDAAALDAAASDAAPLDAAASDADTDASDAAALDAAADVDAGTPVDAGEACPPPEPPTGPPVPDDSLCEGAGINPDFAVKCDPLAMMCVLAKNAPSLK
jgi:hypothetical protein